MLRYKDSGKRSAEKRRGPARHVTQDRAGWSLVRLLEQRELTNVLNYKMKKETYQHKGLQTFQPLSLKYQLSIQEAIHISYGKF